MLSTDARNAPGRASVLTPAAWTNAPNAACSKVLICRFSKRQLGGLARLCDGKPKAPYQSGVAEQNAGCTPEGIRAHRKKFECRGYFLPMKTSVTPRQTRKTPAQRLRETRSPRKISPPRVPAA